MSNKGVVLLALGASAAGIILLLPKGWKVGDILEGTIKSTGEKIYFTIIGKDGDLYIIDFGYWPDVEGHPVKPTKKDFIDGMNWLGIINIHVVDHVDID